MLLGNRPPPPSIPPPTLRASPNPLPPSSVLGYRISSRAPDGPQGWFRLLFTCAHAGVALIWERENGSHRPCPATQPITGISYLCTSPGRPRRPGGTPAPPRTDRRRGTGTPPCRGLGCWPHPWARDPRGGVRKPRLEGQRAARRQARGSDPRKGFGWSRAVARGRQPPEPAPRAAALRRTALPRRDAPRFCGISRLRRRRPPGRRSSSAGLRHRPPARPPPPARRRSQRGFYLGPTTGAGKQSPGACPY